VKAAHYKDFGALSRRILAAVERDCNNPIGNNPIGNSPIGNNPIDNNPIGPIGIPWPGLQRTPDRASPIGGSHDLNKSAYRR
jgi:hypothetical protein